MRGLFFVILSLCCMVMLSGCWRTSTCCGAPYQAPIVYMNEPNYYYPDTLSDGYFPGDRMR